MGLPFKKQKNFYERQIELWEREAEKSVFGSDDYWDAIAKVKFLRERLKDQRIEEKLVTPKSDTVLKALDIIGKLAMSAVGVGAMIHFGNKEVKAEEEMQVVNNSARKAKDNFKPKI